MIQEEQLASDFTSVINDTDIAETKDFDEKIKEDIDKLISLLQKSSQPTRENKIAALFTAIGLGSIIGGLTGTTYRLSQSKVKLDNIGRPVKTCYHFNRNDRQTCSCRQFEMDVSDFLTSSALVGIPVGLVTTWLSLLILKKMIQPKNNSTLNAFAKNLNHFKTALSENEPLSQSDQIKLEKIISLTSTIFEKKSSNSKVAILKKLILTLSGGLAIGYSSGTLVKNLIEILHNHHKTIPNNLRMTSQSHDDILFYTQVFSFLLSGMGLTALISNKLFDTELINLETLHAVITKELQELLPAA